MKNLILIGASGYGREMAERIELLPNYGIDIVIKGFLVHKREYIHSLDNYPSFPPVIGLTDDYEIEEDDVFLCTLGDVSERKTVIESMIKRGAYFYTYIHPRANVSKSAIIGEGTIILENVTIGAGAKIGPYCLIQISAIIAHDDTVGAFSRIDCNAVCVGGVKIGEAVTLHTSSVINHGVTISDNAVVAALSFVVRNVKEGTTVYGNPARTLKF